MEMNEDFYGAFVMGPMEFLYDFLDPDEYLDIKEMWNEDKLSSNVLLYPDRVEIWLLTE